MIIKFHSRGRGCGSGSVDYLLGKDRDREGARLDSGDPEQMIQLIDSINYAQKYKSGVLSFAERDLQEHQKQEIMESFEKTLLVGLEKDQYSILWVQHQDKDRLELNFVIANVELHSGKRLQPYYDPVDRPRLNAWKDLVNDRYQLHDPNDPINKRELCTPNDLPRAKKDASEAITRGLLGLAEQGALKSRSDVLEALKGAGFEIARTTPKSISIKNPDGGQNIRLKGMIYEQDFRFSKELRADIERASESYRTERIGRIQEARATLDRLTEIKRASNQERYPRAEQTHIADYVKNLERSSNSRYHSNTGSRVNFGVAGQENQRELRSDSTAERNNSGFSGQGGQYQNGQLHRRQEPQTIMYSSEQNSRDVREQLHDTNGILSNDRVRKALIRSIGTHAERADSTAERFKTDVREYQAGQPQRQGSIQELVSGYQRSGSEQKRQFEQVSQACEQFERSVRGLQNTKHELNQAITSARNASVEAQKINEKTHGYSSGMRFGR